jgi:hypothetical protein
MTKLFRSQNYFRPGRADHAVMFVHIHETEIFITKQFLIFNHFLQSVVKRVYITTAENVRMFSQNRFDLIPHRSDVSVALILDAFLNPAPGLIKNVLYNSFGVNLIRAEMPKITEHTLFRKLFDIPFFFKSLAVVRFVGQDFVIYK